MELELKQRDKKLTNLDNVRREMSKELDTLKVSFILTNKNRN